MAITKLSSGKWQVIAIRRVNGKLLRKMRTFKLKSQAETWETEQLKIWENQINAGLNPTAIPAQIATLREQALAYIKNIAPTLRGGNQEIRRLKYLIKLCESGEEYLQFLDLPPDKITQEHIYDFMDWRVNFVSGETVRKEVSRISAVFRTYPRAARIENPCIKIDKPEPGKSRTQRIKPDMEEILLDALTEDKKPEMIEITIIAIETAMRFGEIMGLEWGRIDLKGRTIHLDKTKTDTERTIPLTQRALGVLETAKKRKWMDKTPDPKSLVWTISKPSHRSSWQRAMRKLKKSHPDFLDVRFHDLRHEATSRFFELGLDAMRVRLITGHKTLSMLSRYTHLESRDLVGLIDKLQEK